jgi:ABC-type Fe3+-citrate transport system substrate-binding protein
MRALFTIALTIVGLGLVGIAGCSDEAGVKQQTTIKGPEGETKVTKETKIESSGENPPAPAPTPNP